VVFEQTEYRADTGPLFSLHNLKDTGTVELQVINEFPRWNLVSGFRAYRARDKRTSMLTLTLPFPPFAQEVSDFEASRDRLFNSYAYATRRLGEKLFLTAGASIDRLNGQVLAKNQTNPKLGLTWQPRTGTYFRVAAFQTINGPVTSKQLIQPMLEPMQVAGFGQYLFGSEAELAQNYALGFDHALTPELRFAVDFTARTIDVPTFLFNQQMPDPVRSVLVVDESTSGGRVYWTPRSDLAIKAGWQYEDFDYHGMRSPYGFSRLRTRRLPVEATLFVGSAISVRVSATHIRQQGEFESPVILGEFDPGSSRFFVVDASADYRLPNRRGSVEIGIKNLLDRRFQFQDTDPENPHVFPERFLMTRVSLTF
jgi:outer membrane receptor protein involved in Fe transport